MLKPHVLPFSAVDDACSGGTGCGNNEECDTANSLNKCKCAATFINDGTGACVSKGKCFQSKVFKVNKN